MTGAPDMCTATLRPTGPGAAVGVLSGYPRSPMVRTVRTADSLAVEISSGGRVLGRATLTLDIIGDPPQWGGEIEICGCRWWACSARGSGILVLSSPRTPYRAPT
jgi:hypothetical protein